MHGADTGSKGSVCQHQKGCLNTHQNTSPVCQTLHLVSQEKVDVPFLWSKVAEVEGGKEKV